MTLEWLPGQAAVLVNGERHELTYTEGLVFGVLWDAAPDYVTTRVIAARVWGAWDRARDATVRGVVKDLRRKLGHEHIENKRRMGYRVLSQRLGRGDYS